MAKVINITDKLSQERPKIMVGEDEFEVNNTMRTVMRFEELASAESTAQMMEAVEVALGKEAVEKLQVIDMTTESFKVLMIAISAAVQDVSYEEASKRFQ